MYVIYHHPHELSEEDKQNAICVPQGEIHIHLFRNIVSDILKQGCKLPPPENRNIYSNIISFMLKMKG